jgi:hypothetical protein
MTTEIVPTSIELLPASRPSLKSLLDPLLPQQQSYLVLRAMGFGKESAQKMQGLNWRHLKRWGENPAFATALQAVETGQYYEEAKKHIIKAFVPKALLTVDHLLNKAMAWDNQPHSAKAHLMKAVELALRLGEVTAESSGGSYEELILKARRVIHGTDEGNP